MSSSMKRKRPSLKRAAKVGEDGQGRKTYGVSSVPVNDEVDEIEQQPTPAPAVEAQIPASSVDHDDALDTDSSLSPTNSTSPIDPSFLNSTSTLSGSHPGFGSASSQTITPRGQISLLPTILVAPSEDLPVPFGRPEVWAEHRQNLCEALPYYRAYQSGSYTHGGLVHGFLLDKDSGERAYMDEEIVITRAGGGCTAGDNGVMRQSTDQSRGASHIAAFFNNQECRVPIVLIAGSENPAWTCPTQTPYRYCVMDPFQVTHIWAEKSKRKICFKFRLEKLKLESKSWWAPSKSPLPPRDRDFDTKAECRTCDSCHQESVQVFEQAWICLIETCSLFWTVNGSEPPVDLSYNPKFLSERSKWPAHHTPPYRLKPEPFTDQRSHPEFSYSLASWKGLVCPKCGRCNSRTYWREWRCATEGCGFREQIQLAPLSPLSILPDHGVETVGLALPYDKWERKLINMSMDLTQKHWRIHTYEISKGNVITHFHSNGPLNQMPNGPHDMFRELQGADIGLQRFTLKSSPIKGEMLTKHFATNFGMPYKYIVAVDSKGFSEAPSVIMKGLKYLTDAGRKTVSMVDGVDGATYQNCNELLALGYFEQQSISYHDDGEEDLGPTIATMSLGGDAVMSVRMKEAYYSAKKHKGTTPILRGCQLYKERFQLNEDEVTMSRADLGRSKAQFYDSARQEKTRLCPPILTMKLKHGDMVVMHGHEIQKYYEHQVVPQGKLRFALTTRYVDPAKIPNEEHWKGAFKPLSGTIFNGHDVIDDADSGIGMESSSQSSAENRVDDAFMADDPSTSASHAPFSHMSDAVAVGPYEQRCSAPEHVGYGYPAQSFSAPEQTMDPKCLDLNRNEFPMCTNGSTYHAGDVLQQSPENVTQDNSEFEPMSGIIF